ncbi:MAG TPA: hypothetical protein VMW56_13690 [Candidatus Margulisiibacteriota bacterium]|nr:hypothetical protein [Candidatus Margulisiibacteriota bacterium]
MSEARNRLRSLLDTTLTVAAIATSVLAIAVVIGLVWWMRLLSNAAPQEAVVPLRPPPRAAAVRPGGDVPAPLRPAPTAAQRVAAAPAAAPTAAAPTAVPTHGANDDAAKNRALGAALSRLADDPELQRKLHLDAKQ